MVEVAWQIDNENYACGCLGTTMTTTAQADLPKFLLFCLHENRNSVGGVQILSFPPRRSAVLCVNRCSCTVKLKRNIFIYFLRALCTDLAKGSRRLNCFHETGGGSDSARDEGKAQKDLIASKVLRCAKVGIDNNNNYERTRGW